jgi:hypothetical protein
MLLAYEVTRALPLVQHDILTPICAIAEQLVGAQGGDEIGVPDAYECDRVEYPE